MITVYMCKKKKEAEANEDQFSHTNNTIQDLIKSHTVEGTMIRPYILN